MALGGKVVDFIGFELVEELHERNRVGEVAVVKVQPLVGPVLVGAKVVDPGPGHRAAAAHDAVHLVAFFEKQFGQVGTVLAGDTGD